MVPYPKTNNKPKKELHPKPENQTAAIEVRGKPKGARAIFLRQSWPPTAAAMKIPSPRSLREGLPAYPVLGTIK